MAGLAKFNKVREKPLVLLSPLDWGLGHTTRCIPLIRELIHLQCEVIIACTPEQRRVLEIEFQSLTFFEAPADPPVYGKNKALTIIRLLFQVPKNLMGIKQENRWLREFLTTHPVDAIISDNRFGLYAPGIPCIFITHQLHIKTGLGDMIDALAQRINYRFINKFSTCWIPDYEQPQSLAGELSNPKQQPKTKIVRIGGLSRFARCTSIQEKHLLIILSGPEPQRSILEKKIMAQLRSYPQNVILVRGLPGNEQTPEVPKNVQVFNHLPAEKLNELICAATLVISRCGYTTVMDLMKLQKKCILIPTPGQAEQEYLAQHLQKKQLAYTVTQNEFSLMQDVSKAERFPFKETVYPMEEFKMHLYEFVQGLRHS